uniref:Transmembrane 9 superfamily member n=1 Tax=Soboliphyme baturini TaxID=241478 RepID=A0A183I9S3_9BILA
LLDSSDAHFSKELTALDCIPHRYVSTVHLFYVRDGQHETDDILRNSVRWRLTNVASLSCVCFFVNDLFSDNVPHLSWSRSKVVNEEYVFDGQTHLIYWSSPFSEIAFVLPSPRSPCISCTWFNLFFC